MHQPSASQIRALVDVKTWQRWDPARTAYIRRAGLAYNWGLRQLVLVAPILASLLDPCSGPVAAVPVIVVLSRFNRFSAA